MSYLIPTVIDPNNFFSPQGHFLFSSSQAHKKIMSQKLDWARKTSLSAFNFSK